MRKLILACFGAFLASGASGMPAQEPPPRTSLSNRQVKFTVPEIGYAVLRRGPLEAVIVDNRAVDDQVLPGHQASLHGVAALKHDRQPRNLFVPTYSGLNFEFVHDGIARSEELLLEPRKAPLELRRVNEFTAELYQPPGPIWGLESCLRYELLDSGVIELTIECVPHRQTFNNGYIGLFFASYIDHPESLDIHFRGSTTDKRDASPDWIRGVTLKHGINATHLGARDSRIFPHNENFPVKLMFGNSDWRYAEPWYFGRCRDMAFLQVFREADQIRMTQSPWGGGDGCPAWDFQWYIPDYQIGRRYQFVMRAAYFPIKGLSDAAVFEQASRIARTMSAELEKTPAGRDRAP